MKKWGLFLSIAFLYLACTSTPQKDKEDAPFLAQKVVHTNSALPKLGEYWYQGKAEINRYSLQQNRYRDVHPGEAIMVFVTEDFLTDKQVKNDNYSNPNSIGILKNNALRKFPTGIYDYSMMTSVFTPVDTKQYPQTLKITNSSQEWCGHTFMQINYENKAYRLQLNSYFENEGDKEKTIPYAITEDELYNRIRMNPGGLPTGKFKLLPNTVVARLLHLNYNPIEVKATLENYSGDDFEGTMLKSYKVVFPSLNRELNIVFQTEAPYIIEGWTDSYPSVFDKKIRTTIAKRTHTIMSPYWQQNSLEDMKLRAQVGLEGI